MKRIIICPVLFISLSLSAQTVKDIEIPVKPTNVSYLGYAEVNTSGFIYIIGSESPDKRLRNIITFLGSDFKVVVPFAEPHAGATLLEALPEFKSLDVFETGDLEFKVTLNNNIVQDWYPLSSVNKVSADTMWTNFRHSDRMDLLQPFIHNISGSIGIPLLKKEVYSCTMNVNDSIYVEFRNKDSSTLIPGIIAKRLPIKPVLDTLFTDASIDKFLLYKQGVYQGFELKTYRDFKNKWNSLPNSSTFQLPSSSKKILLLFTALSVTDSTLEMQFFAKNKKTLEKWESTGHSVILNNLEPGETYLVRMRYRLQPENEVVYTLIVAPAWYQASSFRWMMVGILALIILFVTFLVYRINIRKQKQKEARIRMELRSIRAQLNPHFVFNSLNSIQGLINKNEMNKANQYLSEFGSLMRDTLTGNRSENNHLDNELKMLENYLRLEQLRFGFQFQIENDPDINPSTTEIPVLLLQPLVENAVKHGVSSLLEKGMIKLSLAKKGADMLVTISDNGKGFIDKENSGYGIQLTKERINLLNEINIDQPVSMKIESNEKGTDVLLNFKNWF